MTTRSFIRTIFVVALTLVALFVCAGDIVDPWHPYGTIGFSADPQGVVTTVDHDAASRGLHTGDRVDFSKMSLEARIQSTAASAALPGRTMVVPLVSGKQVEVVSHIRERSVGDNVTDIFSVVVLVAYALLAAMLVLVRPTPATWAFYVFSLSFQLNGGQDFQYLSPVLYAALIVLISLAAAAAPVAFFSFALRFPEASPTGFGKVAERVSLFAIGPMLAVWLLFSNIPALFGTSITPWVQSTSTLFQGALFLPGIAVLLMRYATSPKNQQSRLRWIVASFAVAFLPLIIADAVMAVTNIEPPIWVLNTTQAWMIFAPVALAYTIFKHRLFDVRLVVSRALVYGLLTSVTVAILALADWGFGRWLAESRFQLVAEVLLALCIGILLTTAHKRIEHALNSVIFRKQEIALAAVRRFTHEIDLITEPQHLLAQIYETIRQRIECDYVAIYTADGNTLVRSSFGNDQLPSLLSVDDLAVLRLRRWSEEFECDIPAHPLQGALLLPMTARAQLAGFIACGPKRDRTHYLPNEASVLETLAHQAGAAHMWLTMKPVTTYQLGTQA